MRILHIIPDIGISNGIMSVILNYAKAMPEDIIFDVVYFLDNPKDARSSIEKLGGRVYKLGDGPMSVIKLGFLGFFRKNRGKWDAVHIHVPYFSVFIAPIARLYGIKKVCCHCHTTLFSLNPVNEKVNALLNKPTGFVVDKKFACGKDAGSVWYKKKEFTVLNNAIDCEKFRFNPAVRADKRRALHLEESLVVAHIGRTDIAQKNHTFLFSIFKEIKLRRQNAKLLIIGGEKRENLLLLCKELGIEDSVEFLGARNDVNELLQAADIFVFPSTREGLPVSVVEAQAAGLPAIISDSITSEVVVSRDLVTTMSLSKSAKEWAQKVLQLVDMKRQDTFRLMQEAGWDIYGCANHLVDYYRG